MRRVQAVILAIAKQDASRKSSASKKQIDAAIFTAENVLHNFASNFDNVKFVGKCRLSMSQQFISPFLPRDAMHCISAAFAVIRWLAGWVHGSHVRVLCRHGYSHSYYEMPIGNRTKLPCAMTLNDL